MIQRILTWNSDGDSAVNCQSFELDSKFIWDFEWISSTRLAVCTHEGTILICDTENKIPIKCLNHVTFKTALRHYYIIENIDAIMSIILLARCLEGSVAFHVTLSHFLLDRWIREGIITSLLIYQFLLEIGF